MLPEMGRAMRARRLAAGLLVPVLAVLPFTDVYGYASFFEHLVHGVATALAVVAFALLVAPVVRGLARSSTPVGRRALRTGVACLHLAALAAGLLILDLGATWMERLL
jgi:hypothetical protein